MQEPHEIEIRIRAYRDVITILKETVDYYEYRLKSHHLDSQDRKQVEYTIQVLRDDVTVNEAMILNLEDDLDRAIDREVRGW